jgi:diguanylate cyclase (GGDEF)-like protein
MSPGGRNVPRHTATPMPQPMWYLLPFSAGVAIIFAAGLVFDYGERVLRIGGAVADSAHGANPITAACLVLLSLAACVRPESYIALRVAWQSAIGLALFLLLARATDYCFDTGIIDRLPIFGRLLSHPARPHWPSVFGSTAVGSLLLLALGQILLRYRFARLAQILLAGSAAGFMVALIGYAAQVAPFDKPMALFIGLSGAACAIALLGGAVNTGFLAKLAPDRTSARLARQVLAVTTIGIVLIGVCVARFSGSRDNIAMVGVVVAFTAWSWGAAIIVAMRFNIGDRKRRRTEERVRHDATTDGLTGLSNGNKIADLIAEQRGAPADAAMIMIDIDRFRSVNNALGTDAGDSLLVQAAKRLSNLAEPHRVARVGGDDFAIFCNGIGPAVANRLAQAVVETMAVPFRLADDRPFHITASVGVAHGATDGIKELRYAADEAMFIAKTQGGNQSVPFVSAMHHARTERIRLEQDLHRACKSSSELFLVYQPIVSLRDRRIVAVEALARWRHPQSGLVPPGRFVNIAETSGMFLGLGCKLRELAITQAARWRDAGSGPLPVINLNVSPLELARSDVPGSLGEIIDRHGLQRGGFCLEVTEGSFAEERALQSLRVARDAGFKVAMDDFGVGYSSLTQLPRLPLTSVKLDRSFLDQAMESEDGISLLATMVQLAHVLKLPVVAEGVESAEELNIVSDCGCDSVQGFLFSEPLTAEELEPWLRPEHKAQARPVKGRAN